MTTNYLPTLDNSVPQDQNEEYSIPLCIDDLITICREYNKLGYHIQQQVENILELGIDEAIGSGYVKREALPLIKNFLRVVSSNPLFGEAADMANDCIQLIQQYEMIHGVKENPSTN